MRCKTAPAPAPRASATSSAPMTAEARAATARPAQGKRLRDFHRRLDEIPHSQVAFEQKPVVMLGLQRLYLQLDNFEKEILRDQGADDVLQPKTELWQGSGAGVGAAGGTTKVWVFSNTGSMTGAASGTTTTGTSRTSVVAAYPNIPNCRIGAMITTPASRGS